MTIDDCDSAGCAGGGATLCTLAYFEISKGRMNSLSSWSSMWQCST